jgi:hypothetical protein
LMVPFGRLIAAHIGVRPNLWPKLPRNQTQISRSFQYKAMCIQEFRALRCIGGVWTFCPPAKTPPEITSYIQNYMT